MICIWSSWCHCHPIISCSSKMQNDLPFWCWLTQVVLEKMPLNDFSSSSYFVVRVCFSRVRFSFFGTALSDGAERSLCAVTCKYFCLEWDINCMLVGTCYCCMPWVSIIVIVGDGGVVGAAVPIPCHGACPLSASHQKVRFVNCCCWCPHDLINCNITDD